MESRIKYISHIFLLISIFYIVSVSNIVVAKFNIEPNDSEFKCFKYEKVSPFSQKQAIRVERTFFSIQNPQLIVVLKFFKNDLTPNIYGEHYTTNFFNQYSFKVSNLLIRYKKKALIFPFQYFW